ncbi:tat pathway signal sequence [Cadophora sp. MPI-SDFR-AT-0126]|nr:tat pathway signal sequence [Leotiomycetes sp. MPI-SDFR-AT-0126]
MFPFKSSNESLDRPSTDEDCESLIKDSVQDPRVPLLASSQKSRLARFCSAIAILTSLVIAVFVGIWIGGRGNPDRFCIAHTSNYSPVLKDVPIRYATQRFNGSLMHENIFRATGSPAVDAAWQTLGVDYRAAIVPPELAAASGLIDSQVQVSERYGGGFPANVEGLHHLHCLNLLRQALYFNFDYYHSLGKGAFSNKDEILRFHVTHCLDTLRQQLMCTADVGVLGQVWWNKDQPAAYPDFNTRHKCRNFEDIRQWAFEHQAPKDVPADYLQMPRIADVYETMP